MRWRARAGTKSSRAPLRGCRARTARTANLRFGDLIDLGEHQGSFVFQGIFHGFVVGFGIFSGAVFEFQVAEIFVDGVAAFKKLIENGAVWSKVGGIRLNVKNKQQHRGGEAETSAEDRPI